MSKEKTIEYRFFQSEVHRVRAERAELAQAKLCDIRMDWNIVSVYTESALRLVTYTYDAWEFSNKKREEYCREAVLPALLLGILYVYQKISGGRSIIAVDVRAYVLI